MGRVRTVNLDLPPGIYKRPGGYYVRFTDKTEQRIASDKASVTEVIAARNAIIKRTGILSVGTVTNKDDKRNWNTLYASTSFDDLPYWAQDIYKRTKVGAKSRKIDFDLDENDFMRLLQETKGKCAVSGVKFNLRTHSNREGVTFVRKPYAPSIDRIDSSDGYRMGNVRVVCLAANYAMNYWGEDVLVTIAKGVYANMKRATKTPKS